MSYVLLQNFSERSQRKGMGGTVGRSRRLREAVVVEGVTKEKSMASAVLRQVRR